MDLDEYRIKARGMLTGHRASIRQYSVLVDNAPHWLPGESLREESQTAIEQIDRLQERLDRKLIITLIGPTGAGKSTLLNALVQSDQLSPSGVHRPTTKEIVVACQAKQDADVILGHINSAAVSIQTGPLDETLEHVILVDTPDMDSTESEAHRPLLESILDITDVLICVLNAENPKRRDTLDFLKQFVSLYPGGLCFVVVNRCDRLPADELKATIIPDIKQHLQAAWQKPITDLFCISARSHLNNPSWAEDEKPLHAYDEFTKLRQSIFNWLNQGRTVLDARVGRADHLVKLIQTAARSRVAEIDKELHQIKEDILALESKAHAVAAEAWRDAGTDGLIGIQAMFYQKLANRWWGPIGWLIALWARFLMTGTGMVAALRIGNPILQLWGVLSSFVRFRKSKEAVANAASGGDVEPIADHYRLILQQNWPDIAEKLIQLGFSPSIRKSSMILPQDNPLGERLSVSWKTTLEEVMQRRTTAISGFLLQLIFNLPTLVLMGLFAYQSVTSFLLQKTLLSGYFLHATISIVLVWILSFVLLQIIIRFVGGKNMVRKVFSKLIHRFTTGESQLTHIAIVDEIDTILQIGA